MISTASPLIAGLSLAMLATQPASSETIQLDPQHGVFMLPVRINDAITIPFVLDSGASEVVIPADILSVLRRAGTISQSDLIGTGTYTLADGSTTSSDRYVLHKMAVGGHVINDVVASVAPAKGDPLLGQSFLSKLPGWAIDNAQHVLVLHDEARTTADPLPKHGLPAVPPPSPAFDPSKPYTGVRNDAGGGHYEGEFLSDKRTGRGILTWASGDSYVGEWRDDTRTGRGVYTWANGDRYDGEWRDDKRTGRGILAWANGVRYDGEWRDGKQNGHGVKTWADGGRFEGEWRDGEQNGWGAVASNGERYEGEWRDGKRTGQGSVTFANGNRYIGEWRDDKPNGYGTYISADAVAIGIWRNGCFKDSDTRVAIGRDLASCP